MEKVSVIIPCYNLGSYLNEAVESVLAQTYEDIEIIIVNDGSTDNYTNELLSNYNKPKTNVITTQNQGLPSARNTGIRNCSGQFICCLDADDMLHPEYISKTVNVLEEDTENKLGFVTTWVQLFGAEDRIWETGDYNPINLLNYNTIHVSSLFRKISWEKVNGYATNLLGYQDWNFWINIVQSGYRWKCIEEPLFLYRRRENSMISTSDQNRTKLIRTIVLNNRNIFEQYLPEVIEEKEKYIIKQSELITKKDKYIKILEEQICKQNNIIENSKKNLFKKIVEKLLSNDNFIEKN